jgi:hypothetical protein
MPRAKTSSKKTTGSKSDFIRAQPANLSAAEVVAKAKAEGIKLDRVLVYKVRIRAKGGPAAKKTPGPKKGGTSKAAFVRGLPASTPAKEVVAKAKALGLSLSVNYVYNIRGAAKTAAKNRRAGTRASVAVPRPIAGSSAAEGLLKALAAEVGLGKAIEILSGERARVRAVIGR